MEGISRGNCERVEFSFCLNIYRMQFVDGLEEEEEVVG